MATHGTPCWYELGAPQIDDAQGFYSKVLGWSFERAPMPGVDYRLASAGGDKIAGMMASRGVAGDPPRQWLVYLTVGNADKTAAAVQAAGGRIEVGPADIPGTGRFARLADPQGALFGILQPLPMEGAGQGGAFNQQATGHGNWTELMTPDPTSALAFYMTIFAWQASQAIDMGEMGKYQLFSHQGVDIGGIMGLGNAPQPSWLPYFGVADVAATVETIKHQGGTIVNGPMEVPGPALIVVALDPWQTCFAVVGPKP